MLYIWTALAIFAAVCTTVYRVTTPSRCGVSEPGERALQHWDLFQQSNIITSSALLQTLEPSD